MTFQDIQAAAKRDFQNGDTFIKIAERYKVSTKTVQRWAKAGHWRAEAVADNIVPLKAEFRERRERQPANINELEIVDFALEDLSAIMAAETVDVKAVGSIASALCRLIELRLKLKPRTASELADMAVALGLKPSDFAQELKERWSRTA